MAAVADFYGQKENLKIYFSEDQSISLAGNWKYMPAAEYKDNVFYIMDIIKMKFLNRPVVPAEIGANTPSLLFNAMINPLVPYTIKGAIWYQGESNAGNPNQYKVLFPLLIKKLARNMAGWRFSFLLCSNCSLQLWANRISKT